MGKWVTPHHAVPAGGGGNEIGGAPLKNSVVLGNICHTQKMGNGSKGDRRQKRTHKSLCVCRFYSVGHGRGTRDSLCFDAVLAVANGSSHLGGCSFADCSICMKFK